MSRVEIFLDGPGRGEVFVDQNPVRDVVSVKLEVRAHEQNIVTIELAPKNVIVSGEAEFGFPRNAPGCWAKFYRPAPNYFDFMARRT